MLPDDHRSMSAGQVHEPGTRLKDSFGEPEQHCKIRLELYWYCGG